MSVVQLFANKFTHPYHQPGTIKPTLLDDVLREYSFLKHEETVLTDTAHTDCLACRESMTACHTDGNRELFRYVNRYAQNLDI